MTFNVFASGSSNTEGNAGATDGAPASGAVGTVTCWNNVYDLGANGTAFVNPNYSNAPFQGGNNFPLWFSYRVAKALASTAKLVMVAKGGAKMADFLSGADWNEVLAVYAASGQPAADVALFSLGGSDANAGTLAADFTSRFMSYDAALRSNGIIASGAPHIFAGIPYTTAAYLDAAIESLAISEALIYRAPFADLSLIDARHFDGNSLCRMGFRCADNYFTHIGGEPVMASPSVFIATEEQASGAQGGTFTSGAWRKRDINTTRVALSGVSLSSGIVTLPEGKWLIEGRACANRCDSHQSRLYDVTGGAMIAAGDCHYNNDAVAVSGASWVSGYIEVGAGLTRQVQLEHRCTLTHASNGLGVGNDSAWGVNCVFAQLKATKL